MGMEADKRYLRYLGARVGGFRNVGWSMANEWSGIRCKCGGEECTAGKEQYWDELFITLAAADPHRRELSIHNGRSWYNHSQPWITHISVQCHNAECVETAKQNSVARPIVMDEVRYEGNISTGWGSMSADQMTQRFW